METEDLKLHLELQPAVFHAAFAEGTMLQIKRKVTVLHSIVCSSCIHQLGLLTSMADSSSAMKVAIISHPTIA